MDDVVVLSEMCVQDYFHLDLLRSEATGAEGMFFVYELDCDDGLGCVFGDGFANTKRTTMLADGSERCKVRCGSLRGICALSDGFTDKPKR